MMPRDLKPGAVVQLSPETGNPAFAFCMMVVTDPKPWGAQGYVQALGDRNATGGRAYYRAEWDDMEYVGHAEWVAQ